MNTLLRRASFTLCPVRGRQDKQETPMKIYILSIAAGIVVGVIYSLMGVRSPAPPLVALVGLLGILVGEQVIPVGKQLLSGTTFKSACAETRATEHVLGPLPGRHAATTEDAANTNAKG